MAIDSDYKMHRPVHHVHHAGRGKQALVVLVLILLFAAIAVVAFSANGAQSISSPSSFNIGTGSSINFMVQNSSRTFTLYVRNSTASGASIYVSSYPVLANPIVSVFGSAGQAFNISTTGNQDANINLKIVSSNATGTKITLTPIPLGLTIGTSGAVSVINPSPLPSGPTSLAQQSTSTTTTTVTTTISSSGSPSTSTTTVATTTIVQVSASIYAIANATNYGKLMSNLGFLYAKGSSCTAPIYNQTFYAFAHYAASPPLDWANISQITPTSEAINIHSISSGYVVNYTVDTPSPSFTGTVINFDMSSTGAVTNLKFEGLFTGENYSDALQGYQAQADISGPCSAFIQ